MCYLGGLLGAGGFGLRLGVFAGLFVVVSLAPFAALAWSFSFSALRRCHFLAAMTAVVVAGTGPG